MPNPAARLLALLLGHEARITDEQWEDVRAMSEQSLFEVVGQILEEESPCPACEAAARELADLRARIAALADEWMENGVMARLEGDKVAADGVEWHAKKLRALLAEKEAK